MNWVPTSVSSLYPVSARWLDFPCLQQEWYQKQSGARGERKDRHLHVSAVIPSLSQIPMRWFKAMPFRQMCCVAFTDSKDSPFHLIMDLTRLFSQSDEEVVYYWFKQAFLPILFHSFSSLICLHGRRPVSLRIHRVCLFEHDILSYIRILSILPSGDILFKRVKEFLHAVVEGQDEEDVINLIQYSYIGNCTTLSSVRLVVVHLFVQDTRGMDHTRWNVRVALSF